MKELSIKELASKESSIEELTIEEIEEVSGGGGLTCAITDPDCGDGSGVGSAIVA